jgi:hypothetical protein
MDKRLWHVPRLVFSLSVILGAPVLGCTSEEPQKAEPTEEGCATFEGTYEAIQNAVFERHGCTASACHGDGKSGGLDLRKGASYENLVEVKAEGRSLVRVQPGAPKESYLYLKLAAASDPEAAEQIANSAMPVGGPPLTEAELEAVRLWIQGGAPETGAVGDPTRGGTSDTIANLLSVCLPKAEPVQIAPLEAPAPDEGIQFRGPQWSIAGGKEREICVATFYDFSDVVPDEFKSPDGKHFYTNGSRLRQDPSSHHYVLSNPLLDDSVVSDPSFGGWRCYGGPDADAECDPLDAASCGGEGICGSEIKDALACAGYGPKRSGVGDGFLGEGLIENVQATNQYLPPREGVYRTLPIRGFLFHNTHAFNLSDREAPIQTRLNVFYAKDRRRRLAQKIDYSQVYIGAGTPPFETREVCADHVAPPGAELIRLTSHTHKRGKRFTVTVPGHDTIYESLIYSDPLYKEFSPGIVLDGATDAERTLHSCSLYNNGVGEHGEPDVNAVTRLSKMPDRASCKPVACVSGRVAAPCDGADDNATCDSEPGAGDGLCDACPITAGVTTEDEMFVVMPWYVLPEGE